MTYHEKFTQHKISTIGVGGGGGGPGRHWPPPPLIGVRCPNFGQFHIFWAILRQNFVQFHINFWAILRQNFGQFHVVWASLPCKIFRTLYRKTVLR